MGFFKLLKSRMRTYRYQAVILLFFSFLFSIVILGSIVSYSVSSYAKQNIGKYARGTIQVKSLEDGQVEKFSVEGQNISMDWVEKIASDEGIHSFDMVSMAGVHGKNVAHMSLFDEELDKEDEKGNLLLVYQRDMFNHPIFKNWGNDIIEGRGLEKDEEGNKAVICRTFADENAISVGDTVKLESLSGEEINLEVIGISSYEFQGNVGIPVRALEYNYIFTTKAVVDKANQTTNLFEADFELTDSKEADLVLKKIVKSFNASDYVINMQVTDYRTMLAAITNNQTTVFMLLIAAIVMGALIISLFAVYSLTERLKEIGILISIGMKKGRIILQYLLELLIPVLAGNLICLCVFGVLKEPLIKFLTKEISIIPDLTVSLSSVQMAGYFACNLLMIIFSIIYVWFKIARCRPKELLIESK